MSKDGKKSNFCDNMKGASKKIDKKMGEVKTYTHSYLLYPLLLLSPDKQGEATKKLLTNPSEIKAFNEEVTKSFKNSGLPVRPGCLLKISSEYYENYGFKATKENKDELIKELNKFFNKDRADEANEKTINPRGIIVQPYTHYANILVEIISELTYEIVKRKAKNDVIKISIIGSRDGTLPLAIINKINEKSGTLIEKTQLYLVEPYQKKLEETINKLPVYGIKSISETKKWGFSAEYKTDDEFLATQKNDDFDIVISYFHMHCKPFSDNHEAIRRVLKNDGLFIIADYFSPLWEYPSFVADFLRTIYGSEEIAAKFAKNFEDREPRVRELSESEQYAYQQHKDYWANVIKELHNLTFKDRKPFYFLRAHTTVQKRIEILKNYQFIVEEEKIASIAKNLKNIPNPYRVDPKSDFVSLIVASKED